MAHQLAQAHATAVRCIGIGAKIDAGEHKLLRTRIGKRNRFTKNLIRGLRPGLTPCNMNDAIRAGMVAAILHFHRNAGRKIIANAHQRVGLGGKGRLPFVQQIYLVHNADALIQLLEKRWVDGSRASRYQNLGRGVGSKHTADGFAGFLVGLFRDGAGVHHHHVGVLERGELVAFALIRKRDGVRLHAIHLAAKVHDVHVHERASSSYRTRAGATIPAVSVRRMEEPRLTAWALRQPERNACTSFSAKPPSGPMTTAT